MYLTHQQKSFSAQSNVLKRISENIKKQKNVNKTINFHSVMQKSQWKFL